MLQDNTVTNAEGTYERTQKRLRSRKSLSDIISPYKPDDMSLSDSFAPENFQTKLERMIQNLNKIKQRLALIQDIELCEQIDWMVDTILKNQLNDVIIKIEKEDEANKEELKRLLELVSEFSSEFNFKRNIESLQSAILSKESELSNLANNKLMITDTSLTIESRPEILTSGFDIFKFTKEVGRENVLLIVSGNIFRHFNLFQKINQPAFRNYIEEIRVGYKQDNPYHNELHAADVAQTISVIMNLGNMKELLMLEHIDILAFILSALVHDFKHPGQTNVFQVNMRTEFALLYNDISVLENMHISEAFRLLNKKDCDILSQFSKDEIKLIRKRMIDMILATDMSLHTKLFTNMKIKAELLTTEQGCSIHRQVQAAESGFSKFESQQDIFNYTLHAADLSHNVKSFEITEQWTNLLMNEFWNQGDLEKTNKLPVSFNCERVNANVPKSQIGFLNGFIIPTFQLLAQMFPPVAFFVDNARANAEKWNSLASIEMHFNASNK